MTTDWVDAWVIELPKRTTRKRLTDELVPQVLRTYYASCDQDFRLTRDLHGRPVCPEIELNFNLGHSPSRAVVAVGLRDKLGLDIERIEYDDVDLDSLVREHFVTSESRFYFATQASKRVEVFYHIWTQKEAVTKAIGLGMKQSLLDVAVEPDPSRNCRLIALNGQAGDGWTLRNIDVGGDHVGVIAAFGSPFLVNLRGHVDARCDEFALPG